VSKIILIGPAHPLRGGIASFNENMVRQLQADGHEVEIYTFSLQYPGFLFPGQTQFSDSPKPKDLSIKVNINSVNPLNWIKIGRELKKLKPDYIIARYWLPFMAPCLGTILRIAKSNKHTHILSVVDNALPHEKRIGDRVLTNYFAKAIDRFIAMSPKVANDLRQFTDKEIDVLGFPIYDNFGTKIDVSQARTKLNISADKRVFLFFGFIRDYKGLDLLIAACDEYDLAKNNAVLLVAGEFYAGENKIMDQVSDSKSKNDILLHTKFISEEEVPLYFSASDVVVQPYRNATQSGVTPLAYHFEVPMIVTNVGALPDMVPEGIGLVCEPTASSIKEAMVESSNLDLSVFNEQIKIEKAKYTYANFTSKMKLD
jgi:glycosyltransferase involved in cell wall biosynthesis